MDPKVQVLSDLWEHKIGWFDMYLDALSDEDLTHTPAPERNHGIWMLAHLIADEDNLALYLGKGEVTYPDYQEQFHPSAPVLPVHECPPPSDLRKQWHEIAEKNRKVFQQLSDDELPEPHALFEEESGKPLETKQLCIMNRILHVAHHSGQLAIIASTLGYEVFQVED